MTKHLLLSILRSFKIFKIKGFGNGYCFHYDTGFGRGFGCGCGYSNPEQQSGDGYLNNYGNLCGDGTGVDSQAGIVNRDNKIMLLNITDS